MTLVGQPSPSPALQKGFVLLSRGEADAAAEVVKKAALDAKRQHGSGSHALALAYADLGRIHFRMGEYERAAKEFQHAASGPMPANVEHRHDRLAMLLGFGAALGELHKLDEAEKVLRQCHTFAKNLHGANSAAAAVVLVPIADVLLMMGKTDEAGKLADRAYETLWKLGDPLFASAVGTRAESLKARGQVENPFSDLSEVPDELILAAVANTLSRAGTGDVGRVRAVLADLLVFVDGKLGDGHALTCDTLAAIVHHENSAGNQADEKVRTTAVRRSLWSYAVRKAPGGLLANLDVAIEPNGAIHLAPHLTREPSQEETAQLELILGQAIDDLFTRPAFHS